MLVRTLLAIERTADARRIRALLRGTEALLSSLRKGTTIWERAGRGPFDLLVADPSTLADRPAETMRSLRDLPSAPDVIVITPQESAEERAELMAAGCLAVLSLELDDETLRESLAMLVARRQEDSRLRLLSRAADQRLGDFVSSSPKMQELLGVSRKVAASDTTLLILGETGVGKEWLARGIHAEGPRAAGSFLAVNCGAIPEGLLESELFGHRKGAFTGATNDRRGHFELAHGGTLFLDEIGEMSTQVQVKLLRALQERTIQPVGSERHIRVDVRVMAATNRDPHEEMEAGRLRQDLYYRLGVVTLSVPALRERREDISDLVANYFEIFRVRLGRAVYGIDREAMAALAEYEWPGNVRELINVMERAVLLCTQEEITLADLPAPIAGRARVGGDGSAWAEIGDMRFDPSWIRRPIREARREAVIAFERQYLGALLAETGGRIGETARRAGVSPRALFARMKTLGLRKEDFKPPRPAEASTRAADGQEDDGRPGPV